MDRTLSHYTLTTGHLRASPRSEVGAGIVEILAPLLVDGAHEMPGPWGYTVRVRTTGATLRADVLRAEAQTPLFRLAPELLVSFWVCLDADGLKLAIREAAHPCAVDVALPACLVQIHPGLTNDQAMHWLGDFERCLAWAWIETVGSS